MAADLVPAEHASWLAPLLPGPPERPAASPEGLMELAIAISAANPRRGGGPFGAVVADAGGRILALGWNDVVPSCDSTAHAEIVALRRAQRALGTHDLAAAGRLVLYASCAPCIQCFGALWWSGVKVVRSAATRADAEAAGFREGPVGPELWAAAERERGLRHEPGFGAAARAAAVLAAWRRAGGEVY